MLDRILLLALSKNYSLDVIKIKKNTIGWNTNYEIRTSSGCYFVKPFIENTGNNHIRDEVKICNYLLNRGYPVSNFLLNNDGEYITIAHENISFHVQHYIYGDIWKKNSAPIWLLNAGIELIGLLHIELCKFNLQRRTSIEKINDKDYSVHKINNILSRISDGKMRCPKWMVKDLEYRKNIINNQSFINLHNLTYVNSHSDYSVSQIITQDKKISGLIDMSEVSYIPAIWELFRFYINSAPDGDNLYSANNFYLTIKQYIEHNKLNYYDFHCFFNLCYYYMCQALSVYEQFIENPHKKFIKRARHRYEKLLRFEQSYDNFSKLERIV